MEALAKLSVIERDTELKSILKSLSALRRGESGVTLPTEWDGIYGKIAAEFNQLSAMTTATTSRCKGLASKSRLATRASRRLPEEKLSGFWLRRTRVAINTVLDEAETVTEQTKVVLTALTDLKKGDARASLPQDWTGVPGKVADAFNDVVARKRAHGATNCAPEPRGRQAGPAERAAPLCPTPRASGATPRSPSTR